MLFEADQILGKYKEATIFQVGDQDKALTNAKKSHTEAHLLLK